MAKLEDAIERIKILECPTGHVEHRIAGILEDYKVANKSEISIKREESLDREGSQGYIAKLSDGRGTSIVVLANSGMDDYVAKVTDVYIN